MGNIGPACPSSLLVVPLRDLESKSLGKLKHAHLRGCWALLAPRQQGNTQWLPCTHVIPFILPPMSFPLSRWAEGWGFHQVASRSPDIWIQYFMPSQTSTAVINEVMDIFTPQVCGICCAGSAVSHPAAIYIQSSAEYTFLGSKIP